LEVTVEDGRIKKVGKGCAISESKFLHHGENRAKPMVRREGKLTEVPLGDAIEKAIEVLRGADSPLIYGLSSTECDAQRLAIELAERIGGTIDNTSSVCHGPTILAAQGIGAVKCTLGEVKNRADLVIFWGCNPGEAHIRHFVRYTTPKGLFTAEGRRGRTIVCLDVRETPSTRMADVFIKAEPGHDFELISALRATIRGHEIGDVAGVSSG
jgi:formylmethanofuran dehydrogenase subunit B